MSEEEKTEELDDGIIELIDEEDNVVKFRLLDVTEYKAKRQNFL